MKNWIVTYDHTEERAVLINREAALANLKYPFRLYDDDGVLYFSGLCSTRDDGAAFDPLDALMNAYGVTEIQYQQDDLTWEVL